MGSLQESLNRFKKQQEKCQSTLKSIAADSKTTIKTTAPPAPRVVPRANTSTELPSLPIKFSNDTERLQHINNIRKGPVGAQIKRVIDLLFEVQILHVLVLVKLVVIVIFHVFIMYSSIPL